MGAVLSSLPGADSQLNPRVTRDIEKQVDNLVRLRKLYPAKIGTAEITAIEKCIQVVIPEIHRRWFWREWLEYTNLLTLLVIVVGSGWLAWRFLWPPSVWTPILLVLMGVVIVVLAQAMFALIIKAERIFIRWRTGPIETILVSR